MSISVLAISGSLRSGSLNRKLVHAAKPMLEEAGASVTILDWNDYDIPMYNGDLEEKEGLPESVKALKELFKSHEALFFASPEYNSSYSGALKNLIDWVSRPNEGEKPLECFRGKVAAITSASPGGLGGLRGLLQLRALLANIHVNVITDQLAVSGAQNAFEENNTLKDSSKAESLAKITGELVRVASALK